MRTISLDLRERILSSYDQKEGTKQEIAVRYRVSLGLVKKLLQQFLPAYSPDFNPIEMMWSKVKASLRSTQARTTKALTKAIAAALDRVTPQDARNWFAHSGYSFI